MPTITLTRGLPASGKTTWAKAEQEKDPNLVRVNKDDLRAMLHLSKWTKENEKQVLRARDFIVEDAIRMGRNVIVDDTNGHHKHGAQMEMMAARLRAEGHKVHVEVKPFDADVEECIRRDLQRPNSVGEKIIRDMHKRFFGGMDHHQGPRYAEQDELLPPCIICDLDGTLAILNGRSPYDGKACASDLLNEPVARLLRKFEEDAQIILFSGRNGESEPETRAWLREHGIVYDKLVMRAPGDQRKDAIVKREMYEEHIEGKRRVLFVVDDRDQVVNLWRHELKLPCFQVYDGDF